MSLKAILFDYGKVLCYPPTNSDWDSFAALFGVSVAEFQRPYWKYRDEYDRATIDAAGYWGSVASHLGRTLSPALLQALVEHDNRQWTNINPNMLAFARRARQAGLKIGILSNMQHDMLAAMRKEFAWLSEFDAQVYTCEVHVIKPEAEAYLISSRALDVAPSEVLFLDDKQPNIDGARAVGMHAELFEGDHEGLYALVDRLGVPLEVTE